MKRFLILLTGLVFAVACGTTAFSPGSGTKSSTSKSSTYNLAVGETVDLTDTSQGSKWSVTVNSIKGFTSDNEFEKPSAGEHFIVIDVTYAVTAGTADSNEFDWEAKDPSGLVSPRDIAPVTLPATTVEAPNKVRGTVVLEIPIGSGGTVVYTAGLSEKASWSFSAADVA